MSEYDDFTFALEMQKQWNGEQDDSDIEELPDDTKFKPPLKAGRPQNIIKRSNPRSNLDEDFLNRTQNLVHPLWESLDPTPDVQSMFQAFDGKFFQGRLKCVTLEWSKRMYSCAGICYSRKNRLGMSITIRLSQPLLMLRPRKDLVETMLHEMIHAYCFVLGIREGNGGHGPNFKKIMGGINKVAGTNITVYHTFHDEVNVYKTHWWRCNGSCQHRSPFFGYVKRTSNRAPGPNDQWWANHLSSCGGTFMKIKEPEKKPNKKLDRTSKKSKPSAGDLRKFFPTTSDGAGNYGSVKGPIKVNGGGTLLLNPKTKSSSTVERPSLPPTHTPDTIRSLSKPVVPAGGNLKNVIGLGDLNSSNSEGSVGRATSSTNQTSFNSMSGTGYPLSSGFPLTVATRDKTSVTRDQVDRNHLRDVWAKRFGGASSEANKDPDVTASHGDSKRRRVSVTSSFIADESVTSTDPQSSWLVIDDDVMLKDKPEEVIAILSSDEDSDDNEPKSRSSVPNQYAQNPLTSEERQNAIKQEIMDESFDNNANTTTDNEIILIDDDFDDDEDLLNTSASELADTSLIDDLFGDDTLLKEFKLENDVVPSGSRYQANNPRNDIITCPICQEKMKREVLVEHLDGCTGITIKVNFPKQGAVLKKLASTSKKITHKKKSFTPKEILLNAGYSEQDLLAITGASSTDEEEPDLNSSDQLRRQRGLFIQTRTCPVCCSEVEVDSINDHLDECLTK